jgi:hypothetical protein
MHPDTKQVAHHMREFGLSILGRAIYDATFSENMRPFAHPLAVVHAAHGAEIVLKARIAEEHPLLIFSKLPPPSCTPDSLTIQELFEYGRSYDYGDLPNLLWAATGHRIVNVEDYQSFGKLRNQIVHFGVPQPFGLAEDALRFCIEVLEPILDQFWGESAIPYAEEWDDVIASDGYLEQQLRQHGIKISESVRKRLGKTPPED